MEEIKITQFGLCARCRSMCNAPFDEHNIIIYSNPSELSQCNYIQSYAYDLCQECINEILNWIENGTNSSFEDQNKEDGNEE